jgi:hypothetical protein
MTLAAVLEKQLALELLPNPPTIFDPLACNFTMLLRCKIQWKVHGLHKTVLRQGAGGPRISRLQSQDIEKEDMCKHKWLALVLQVTIFLKILSFCAILLILSKWNNRVDHSLLKENLK